MCAVVHVWGCCRWPSEDVKLMLEDGDPEYQPKPEIEGEGEDAGVDLSWIAGVGHKQEVVKVEPETKSFESKVPGMRKCTVYFDN